MITSMREHKGHLYIGGILNNRVGKLKLDGVDANWMAQRSYWGGK
jgi:ribose transport system permease protein